MSKCEGDRENRNYYRYYDTPEGCDIPKKIMVMTKYGIVTGLIIAAYDVVMFTRALRLEQIMQRYIKHTVPLGVAGATFPIVTNAVMQYRQIDDHLNYFIGAVACGPILGRYLQLGTFTVPATFALGLFAMVKKEAVEKGWVFFPHIQSHMNHVRDWRHDYTLAKDPRDEWIHTCKPTT